MLQETPFWYVHVIFWTHFLAIIPFWNIFRSPEPKAQVAIVIAHCPPVYGTVYYETLCRLKFLSWQFRLHYSGFSEEFAVLRRYKIFMCLYDVRNSAFTLHFNNIPYELITVVDLGGGQPPPLSDPSLQCISFWKKYYNNDNA